MAVKTRNDEEIRQEVLDGLHSDSRVDDSSIEALHTAHDIAARIPGVTSIINKLSVA